jgi:hypothetical protein
MVLSMQTIIEMKKELDESFGLYLHVRDACAGQSFRFEAAPDEQALGWICDYVAKLGGSAHFYDGGKQFTVD